MSLQVEVESDIPMSNTDKNDIEMSDSNAEPTHDLPDLFNRIVSEQVCMILS
jgi:hypothetical protein